MKLIESCELVSAMTEEVRDMQTEQKSKEDQDGAMKLHMGLLWLECKLLRKKLSELESKQSSPHSSAG